MTTPPNKLWTCCLALVLGVSGSAQVALGQTSGTTMPTPAPTTAPATTAARLDPDQKRTDWLTDKEGRKYVVEKLERRLGQKMSSTSVRTVYGISVDIVREDPDFFYYKSYKLPTETGPVVKAGPSEDDIKAAAAEYVANTPESSRLLFREESSGLPTAGQWRQNFDAGDMNEDGHLDLVFGPPRKSGGGRPVIFLGDGHGKWTRWKEARFPPLPYDYGTAAVGDIDGDGHQDIVLGVHLRGLLAVTGDGKGNFTDASKGLAFSVPGHGAPSVFSSQAIALVDWNHDKKLDILALGEGPALNLTPGSGTGTRQPAMGLVAYLNQGPEGWTRRDVVPNWRLFGTSLLIADVNHDGTPDVVSGSSVMGGKNILLLGQPDGTLKPADVSAIRPGALIRSVAAADFDGDGRVDLAIAYTAFEGDQWHSAVDVLYQKKQMQWTRHTVVSVIGIGGPMAVAVGNLDGDGRPDLVVGTAEGEIWPFLNSAEGFFTREQTLVPGFGKGCSVSSVLLRDYDGDHRDDIIAAFASEGDEDPTICPGEGGVAAWTSSLTK